AGRGKIPQLLSVQRFADPVRAGPPLELSGARQRPERRWRRRQTGRTRRHGKGPGPGRGPDDSQKRTANANDRKETTHESHVSHRWNPGFRGAPPDRPSRLRRGGTAGGQRQHGRHHAARAAPPRGSERGAADRRLPQGERSFQVAGGPDARAGNRREDLPAPQALPGRFGGDDAQGEGQGVEAGRRQRRVGEAGEGEEAGRWRRQRGGGPLSAPEGGAAGASRRSALSRSRGRGAMTWNENGF